MELLVRSVCIGISLSVSPMVALGQINQFQGIYVGRLLVSRDRRFQWSGILSLPRIEDVFTLNGVIQNGHHTVRIFHKVRS
jgi:hypothetical protein